MADSTRGVRAIGLLLALWLGSMAACTSAPGVPPTITAESAFSIPAVTASPAGYPIATPTRQLSTEPYPGPFPTNNATQASEVAHMATLVAASDLTLTAWPTVPATPTFPPDLRLCGGSDLAVSVGWGAATAMIQIYVVLKNSSPTTCYLQGPPVITLLDNDHRPLELAYDNSCYACPTAGYGEATAVASTQAAIDQQMLSQPTVLEPLQQTLVTMTWMNWCQPAPMGGLIVRLNLQSELVEVDGIKESLGGGRCEQPDAPSSLSISQYQSYP